MIETERILLLPLSYDQLLLYIKADNVLETTLGLLNSSRKLSDELRDALENTLLPNVADATKDFHYSTLWTIISKEEKSMVGDICICGEPNQAGEIEIGYGTYEEFQGRGFMTEGVAALLQWAAEQPEVESVIASTNKENIGSYTILKKNKFVKVGESEDLFNWKRVLR